MYVSGTLIFLAILLIGPLAGEGAERSFIRFIVPKAPGSGNDVQARMLNERMGKVLGKPVMVENIPGAGDMKGTLEIVRGPKDGTTIGLIMSNNLDNPFLYKDVPYDPIKDLPPISIIGYATILLTTGPGLPVRNLNELIALAPAARSMKSAWRS
jgi:tripartite-type tricarboxylate transporter receptor subunit TctC